MPRTNSVQQFVALKSALEQERSVLQQRLQEIDRALGAENSAASGQAAAASQAPAVPAKRRGRPPGSRNQKAAAAGAVAQGGARRGRRPRNEMSMRDAIANVVKTRPMRIRDIVDGMGKLGFVFKSKNPVNSVGAYLYGPEGRKHFKRADGTFSVK